MKTVSQVMTALKKKGSATRIKTFVNHGAPADKMFGVSVADMKVIAKQIKGEQELASSSTRPTTETRCTWRGWWRTDPS